MSSSGYSQIMDSSDLACVIEQSAQWALNCQLASPRAQGGPGPWDFGWIHLTAIFAVVAALLTLAQKFRADRASQVWSRIEWSLSMAKTAGPERTLALIHVSGLLEPKQSKLRFIDGLRTKLGISKFKYDLEPVDVETLRQAGLAYQGADEAAIKNELDIMELEGRRNDEGSSD